MEIKEEWWIEHVSEVLVLRVIVVGAGEVGTSIATDLAKSHEVIVIDQDKSRIDDLNYSIDVLPIHGNGTELETLRSADIEAADLVIACTDVDEVNIVVCGISKAVTDSFTIARTKRRYFLDVWQDSPGAFGVDFMVCSDLLTAEAIFRIAGLPGAHDVESFANGLIRMAEFVIHEDHPVVDQRISEVDRFTPLTFAAIFRGDDVLIPRGDTIIQPNDRVVVIGSSEDVNAFADETRRGDDSFDDVVILGGGRIGFQTAKIFSEHGYKPRLIERDGDRAKEIAVALPEVLVMENDATDLEFLTREHIGEADILVTTLSNDEMNLLVSLLAKQLGVDRIVTLAETSGYAHLFETVGVEVALNPRIETAEEIIRFTRAGDTEKIAMVEHDRAEVLEIEVDEESILAGRKIADSTADLPDDVVIGAIARSGQLIPPRGDTVVQPGDHLVVFVNIAVIEDVLTAI